MGTRYFGSTESMSDQLTRLATLAERFEKADVYAEGGPIEELETRVAALLGKQKAAFFPSGIMAQQSALRTWTDRRGSKRVAIPPRSHLLTHEMNGPRLLHGLQFEDLGSGPDLPTGDMLRAIPGRLGATLFELPQRDSNYAVPSFDELADFSAAAREREIPFHLDGARLWEAQPWMGRPLGEIASLADSVYVSFYKGLGGIAGACLAADADVIDEAILWRKRMGGTLFQMYPMALAALDGLDTLLPRMGAMHDYAVELGTALVKRGFVVDVDQIRSVAFCVHAPRPASSMNEKADELETPDLGRWRESATPGWCWRELTVSETTMHHSPDAVAHALGRLIHT